MLKDLSHSGKWHIEERMRQQTPKRARFEQINQTPIGWYQIKKNSIPTEKLYSKRCSRMTRKTTGASKISWQINKAIKTGEDDP